MRAADTARDRLRATGERVTPARVRVLSTMLQSARPLSHHEFEEKLSPIDRVTLYRVLDWLVEQGIAHRVSGADRVWRFGVARDSHGEHPHFQCNQCGKVLCLAEATVRGVPVPKGFRPQAVELTVKGLCSDCN